MPTVRESAIDIIVEHPAIAGLPYWREAAASGIPPHITLLFPWRTPPVDSASLDALRSAIRDIRPFELRLGGVSTFPQGVVYAAVEANAAVRDVIARLMAAFPDTPPYRGAFGNADPVPHLTLAHCSAGELEEERAKLTEALAGALPLTVQVTEISVIEQSADRMWSVTATLPLRS